MTECFKGILPVVISAATETPPAKRQMMIRKMPAGIVDTTAAKSHTIEPIIFPGARRCENIKSQRVGMLPDDLHRFFFCSKADNRKNGAKYFIIHHCGPGLYTG